MIGVILTGHGEFAVGVGHALEMIAGKQPAFRVVPFHESDSLEVLVKHFKQSIAELLEETAGVVIFADLLGGSPFKAAMLAAADYESVEVAVGTNLPMLIEIAIAREFAKTPIEVINASIVAGREGIQHTVLRVAPQPNDFDEAEDGI